MKKLARFTSATIAGILLCGFAATPASAGLAGTPRITKMTRHELLIPGTTPTNTGNSQINHSTVLADGGIAVCGFFNGVRKFGKTTITNRKSTKDISHIWQKVDAFVAKADASGNWVWAASVPATLGGDCRTISEQPDGQIRVRVNTSGVSEFAGTTMTGSVNADIFVSRAGKPLKMLAAQPEPEQVPVANVEIYPITALGVAPAIYAGKPTQFVTTWNINGALTNVDFSPTDAVEGATYPLPGILAKWSGSSWSWVVKTPGTTEISAPILAPTSDGGVVVTLRRLDTSPLQFDGFTATSGENALAKFNANGQPVWGFEVPHRRITAYAELPGQQFAVAQGVESAFVVGHFKLQVYSAAGKLLQTLNLPHLAFPPRSIHFTGTKSAWLQTNNSVILLRAQP